MRKLQLTVALLLTGVLLPGCIAWEIRDEVRTTNEHLCEVGPTLAYTLHGVEETNRQIELTNARLAEVQAALALTQAQLSTVQATLKQTDEHMVAVSGTLGSTNPKLDDLGGALKPLSGAMGSLGGAMSFLGMSSSSEDLLAEESAAPKEEAPKVEATGAAPSAEPEVSGAGAEDKGGKRPDPVLGTWVLIYPPPAPPQTIGRIFVLTSDGRFMLVEQSKPIRPGSWGRRGRTLYFTYDAVQGGPAAVPETGELLTLNSRTLTIKVGDAIRIYSRP